MDDLDALDFPSPHAHLNRDQLHSAWNAEWARIRAWTYELNTIWARNPTADFVWVMERKAELRGWIVDGKATTLELEDALMCLKPRPTDIPQPWGVAMTQDRFCLICGARRVEHADGCDWKMSGAMAFDYPDHEHL